MTLKMLAFHLQKIVAFQNNNDELNSNLVNFSENKIKIEFDIPLIYLMAFQSFFLYCTGLSRPILQP